jgi:hypothetical protein
VGFTVKTALWVKNTPTLAGSTVLYLFSGNVACGDISASGWDQGPGGKPAAGTKVVELDMGSATPMQYPIATTLTATTANASYGVVPVANDDVATSGTLTLSALNAGMNVTGCFDVTLTTNGHISGTFDAKWCATGTEP